MKQLFERTSAVWVRYDEYEWRSDEEGILYLTPTKTAKPGFLDPLEEYEQLVLDALDIGRRVLGKEPEEIIQTKIHQFALNYGLFGLMTALPTTPNFMDYESVYLPKNSFIREESMATYDYLRLFFPFEPLDVTKYGVKSQWTVSDDKAMIALLLTMSDRPMAVNMSFQREYAERYDWMKQQFLDWAFMYFTSQFYYEDRDDMTPEAQRLMQQSMAAYEGNAPTYHIALLDKPTIVWNFNSLLLGIQLMFSFMLADDKKPIRVCKHCTTPFVASRPSAVFCSPQCKNRYNVYKSRAKKKESEDSEDV